VQGAEQNSLGWVSGRAPVRGQSEPAWLPVAWCESLNWLIESVVRGALSASSKARNRLVRVVDSTEVL
jgi:hypothetical protein